MDVSVGDKITIRIPATSKAGKPYKHKCRVWRTIEVKVEKVVTGQGTIRPAIVA